MPLSRAPFESVPRLRPPSSIGPLLWAFHQEFGNSIELLKSPMITVFQLPKPDRPASLFPKWSKAYETQSLIRASVRRRPCPRGRYSK